MNYKVTTLSPLLVGDGRALSPVDYMVWKDQVNVLDQNRIFRLLSKGPRLEGYLTQLRKAVKLDFASWGGFAQNFSLRRIPFENAASTPIWNAASSELLFIPTFASQAGGAYLPASAVKGALRTAFLASRWNAGTMERLASSVENDRYGRRATETAEAKTDGGQMRLIAIGDSQPIAQNGFRVFLSRVASLNHRDLAWKVVGRGYVPPARVNDATPTFLEMALPGVSFGGRWNHSDFLRTPELQRSLGWRSVASPESILEAANAFARLQLQAHGEFAAQSRLPLLQGAIEKLAGLLDQAQSSKNSCLLCLGWGGGYVSKGLFRETADPNLRRILKTVPSFARALKEGAPFPKTRRVLFIAGQPATLPGWVRLDLS